MSFLATFSALASGVLVQSYDYVYSTADDLAAGGALATFGVAYWVIMCCSVIVGLASFGITVWMLIDVLKRSDAEMPNKVMWVLIILLTGGIGALVYFFTERKKLNSAKK